MSSNEKIGRITLLLFLGLLAFVYILANTAADLYYISSPAIGVYTAGEEDTPITVVRVVPGGPANRAGLKKGDVIVALNGQPVQDDVQFTRELSRFQVGETVTLTVRRGSRVWQTTLTIGRRFNIYTQVVLLSLLPRVFFCYALLLIGTFVFLKKIEDRTAHVFYLMVLFWALAMWHSFPNSLDTLTNVLPGWYRWIQLPFWPLAVSLLLHFTLIFPVRHKWLQTYPRLVLGFVYLSVWITLAATPALVAGVSEMVGVINLAWNILFAVNFFLVFRTLARSAWSEPDPHRARQAQIMFWGTLFALALPTAYYYLPQAFFGRILPGADTVLFLLLLWPATLAYVIIKHRFMDIDVIVKRGVAYAMMSGFVVAAYFLLVVGVGKLVLYLTGSTNQLVTIIATLIIAAVFNPVKNRIRLFVDRRFYPSRFLYREAIRQFNHQLRNVVDLQKLLDLLQGFFTETMRIRPSLIFWKDTPEPRFVLRDANNPSARVSHRIVFTEQDAVLQKLRKQQGLVDLTELTARSEEIPPEEWQRWRALQTELVLPLLKKDELVGFITLGLKEDEEPYYKEDLDLLATLNDQVNMTLENALLTEELREQERLKKELEVARRIQLSTLPQGDPQFPGLDVSGVSLPALEVGGDYYDYLELSNGRLAVVVGDVSGKGTSAALYMTQLKGILKTAAKFHRSLTDLLAEVNDITFRSVESKAFITLMCGAFDGKTRTLHLVRAGHLPLVYFCAQDGRCHEATPRGIGLGLDEGKIFRTQLEEAKIRYHPGDVFLFYSDGVVEARNREGREFDTEPLRRLLEENGHCSAVALRDRILDEVQTFVGPVPQHDDLTLVVVKATG